MRLKELKCKNCGATLKVDASATQVKCDFCHTEFAVEDAYHDGYKFEKGRIKAQNEHIEERMSRVSEMLNNSPAGKMSKIPFIIFSIFFALVFCGVFFFIIMGFVNVQSSHDDFDIRQFNNGYETYVGTERGLSVGRLIDEITTNNKTNSEHKITLKYKEIETQDPDEMKNIKKQLDDWTDYEVSFEYDEDGFIYYATIED